VQEFAARFETMNFFDMLALTEASTPEEVQEAYFAQAKRFHPDRLPAELAPIRVFADRIFHYLTEARDMLSDTDKRMAYVKTVRGGGGTPEADRKMQAILTAAMEFQKVEVLARRRDWDLALQRLDVAIELNADEPDFYAFKAWLLFEKHGTTPGAPIDLMLKLADRALALRDNHERAHFTKATVLDRMGKTTQALEHFKRAAQINPKNLDAARRVRLADMRARASQAPPESTESESTGLLSKLFTKKKD
jgi:curved DNA-binding protein CbpA